MVVAGVLSNELSKQGGVVAEVAVEAATGGAGGARPSALTAAEWDDRGEHDYTSFGCSPSLRTFRCLSSRGMLWRRRRGGGRAEAPCDGGRRRFVECCGGRRRLSGGDAGAGAAS